MTPGPKMAPLTRSRTQSVHERRRKVSAARNGVDGAFLWQALHTVGMQTIILLSCATHAYLSMIVASPRNTHTASGWCGGWFGALMPCRRGLETKSRNNMCLPARCIHHPPTLDLRTTPRMTAGEDRGAQDHASCMG